MSKFVTFVGWEDVPHISADAQAEMAASYMPHERDARTKGIPSLGAGAIYPIPESDILVDPFDLPPYCRYVYAMDVGWNRTAALWGALDPEEDVLYLWSEYYRGQAEPAVHAQAIQSRGKWVPGVIDPAARGRQQKDGESLLDSYRALGLTNLIPANNAREAGIYNVWSRLSTGRLRVFRTLQNFMAEYRIYRRDEKGAVVKENDHLMDCMRYMVMSGTDLAQQRPPEQWPERLGARPGPPTMQDYDPYASAWSAGKTPNSGRQSGAWMPGRGRM